MNVLKSLGVQDRFERCVNKTNFSFSLNVEDYWARLPPPSALPLSCLCQAWPIQPLAVLSRVKNGDMWYAVTMDTIFYSDRNKTTNNVLSYRKNKIWNLKWSRTTKNSLEPQIEWWWVFSPLLKEIIIFSEISLLWRGTVWNWNILAVVDNLTGRRYCLVGVSAETGLAVCHPERTH
jgi:hypothetical protein